MDVQDRWYHAKRRVRELVEDGWFDRTHHVRTMGDVALREAGIADADRADSELYVPARPANIREALRAAPVRDVSQYTFVDFGSGRGRALFVAAEMPFRRVVGVEFSGRRDCQLGASRCAFCEIASMSAEMPSVTTSACSPLITDSACLPEPPWLWFTVTSWPVFRFQSAANTPL